MFQVSSGSPLIVHEKFYGLLVPRAADSTPISDDVRLDTVLPSTRIMKNHFDTKVHIYAFIMLILNAANKINTF